MAKIAIPTTPEELAALTSAATPKPADTGATPPQLAQVAGGAQRGGGQTGADLKTGLPPAPPPGPQTPVPPGLLGPQGELLTGMPKAAAAPAAVVPPQVAQKAAEVKAAMGPGGVTAGGPDATPPAGKKKSEFGKKLGQLAKMTGRSVLELVQAFTFGYTGYDKPLQYEVRKQQESDKAKLEAERAYQERIAQINRDWQATQNATADANQLARERARLEADAREAALDRASNERIAGIRSAGVTGTSGDPLADFIRSLQAAGGGKKK